MIDRTYTYSQPLRDSIITLLEDLEKHDGLPAYNPLSVFADRATVLLARVDAEDAPAPIETNGAA